MIELVANVVGWAGTIALLLSFGLLTAKRIESDGYQYQALNAVGAFLLAITTAQAHAWSAVALIPFGPSSLVQGCYVPKRNGQHRNPKRSL